MNNSTTRARQRILRLLSRQTLEDLSTKEKPWHVLRGALEEEMLANWPAEAIGTEVEALLRLAAGK